MSLPHEVPISSVSIFYERIMQVLNIFVNTMVKLHG